MPQDAAHDELTGPYVDHDYGPEPTRDADHDAFTGELVDNIEHAVLPTVMSPVLDETVRPDTVDRGPHSILPFVR